MAGSPPAQTAGRTQHPLPPSQTERSPSSSQELLLKEVSELKKKFKELKDNLFKISHRVANQDNKTHLLQEATKDQLCQIHLEQLRAKKILLVPMQEFSSNQLNR